MCCGLVVRRWQPDCSQTRVHTVSSGLCDQRDGWHISRRLHRLVQRGEPTPALQLHRYAQPSISAHARQAGARLAPRLHHVQTWRTHQEAMRAHHMHAFNTLFLVCDSCCLCV